MSHIPLNRVKPNGKVDLWDMGPPRPVSPEPPKAPDENKLRGDALATAQIDYEDATERFKEKYREYQAARVTYLKWHDQMGGPVKVDLWGVDARHAMVTAPNRYVLNLPKDTKPGRAQLAADEMAIEEAESTQRAHAADPQFGGQVGAMT